MDIANLPPMRKRRKSHGAVLLLMLLLLLFLLLLSGLAYLSYDWYEKNYGPVYTRVDPDYGVEKPIIYKGEVWTASAIGTGETLKLPLSLVQERIDSTVIYEEDSKSVIITNQHEVLRLVTDQLTAWLNERPVALRFPIELDEDGQVYIPIELLSRYYGIKVDESPQTGIVTIQQPGDVIAWVEAVVTESEPSDAKSIALPVRLSPSIRAGIVGDLAPGERAKIWGESRGWYFVQIASGRIGYVDKRDLEWKEVEVASHDKPSSRSRYVPPRPMGESLFLVWEQVYANNPDPSQFDPMPGLNVVSPTWFHLMDEEGTLENRADMAYATWAQQQGYQIWALFSNGFDPDLTQQALATYDRRMTMARQLISWAALYELDGINVDFENVYLQDGPKLTQFMRELKPLLHEAGLTLSIDVTFISSNENWSMFYDRTALAEIVDYMIIMAYDEHWATSPVAGSVASLPWVERGLKAIIEQSLVPPEKIVLGVPFYTRRWAEQESEGNVKVSSKALGMDAVEQLIQEKGLKPVFDPVTQQNYVEYEEKGVKYKIWLEDELSMRARIELVDKYGLAGIAAWSRNFANESIWTTIYQELQVGVWK